MMSIIKAILLGALLQIAVGAGLTVYLFNHTSDMALQYAQMAERNANIYTDVTVRDQYNRLQREQSSEREDMKSWVDRRIYLKVSQALGEIKH
ncbi:hypothetical protein KVQ82_23520 [Pseudomonas sp. AO-1]|uniref:hypothetical protein n=1 Tax=Pseudomonas sp. AO-1 TaxID=2855434 RepID=UPI001C7671D0|nr:hypothetical protein [Pseudomonas sp. AO-1]QXZ13019.1 hypothetical protein KVQ82_23520 [Pseudomonas sp. AO-1]